MKEINIILVFIFWGQITVGQEFSGISKPSSYYLGEVPISKIPFNHFIKKYVEDSISSWQKKGKTEKSTNYRNRIENQRQNKIAQLTADAMLVMETSKIGSIIWKFENTENYDADNETYKLSIDNEFKDIVLNVPTADVTSFDNANVAGKLNITNPDLAYNGIWEIKSFTVVNQTNNKKYQYNSQTAGTYSIKQFNLTIEDVSIVLNREDVGGGKVITNKIENIGTSDVDLNIPVNAQTNDKTFVVIIANENYQKEVKVQFASSDGKIFKEYCEKTIGIPSKNIHYNQDATFGIMKSEIKWISDVIGAYNGEAKVIFYYAGHGMPNESDLSAYLLPVDGFSSDFETTIKLDDLYDRLAKNAAQSVTVFLDACFSGSIRDNGMLANTRSVVIKPSTNIIKGNLVVFSAATGKETAFPYKEKQHGLFTYFLLKKLQETKGNVDYQTLSDYITENVKQQSIVVNQKSQTPQVNASEQLQNKWKIMRLK